jgi:hypothetical protein
MQADAIKKMAARFKDESVGMAVCSRYAETIQGTFLYEMPEDGTLSSADFVSDRLQGRGGGCPAAEMFRLELVRQSGGYQEIGFAMDLLLELDVGAISAVAYIKEPLIHYTLHAGNASVTRPVEYIQSHAALAALARNRYEPQVAERIRRYSINAVYGCLKGCSVNRNHMATNAGLNALMNLKAPCWISMPARLLSFPPVQFALNSLRALKRGLKRNGFHE